MKEEQGLYSSSIEDACGSTGECYCVDCSVITAAASPPTGNEAAKDDNFSAVVTSDDLPRSDDLEDLCDCIETRLLLFQSSFDLFSDVRGSNPKSEQVEVFRPIQSAAKAETIDTTPKPTAQTKKKKSALKSCLKILEQGTCSVDEDLTADTSITLSGRRKSVVTSTFQCYPEDDVQADDKGDEVEATDGMRGVHFAEITVRTFACRLGDNPSTSKYTSTA